MVWSSMDFKGQILAERFLTVCLIAFGVLAWVISFVMGSWKRGLEIMAVGTALAALAVLPPWPWYRRNPVKWQPKKEEEDATGKNEGVDVMGWITTSVLVTLALIYAFMLVSSPNKSVVVFGMDLTRLIRGVPVLRAARKHIRRGIEALPIYGPKLASFFNR